MSDEVAASKILEQYRQLGFAGPFKAFDEAELAGVAEILLKERKAKNNALAAVRNRHLDWDMACNLISARAIRDVAREIMGQELVLWRTNFFVAKTGEGIRWHQDEYQTLLADPLRHLSVHLAITEATVDNCIILIPDSHVMTRAELAAEGFNFIEGSDKGTYGTPNFWCSPGSQSKKIKMLLKPGEFFVFHPLLMHASYDLTVPPNEYMRIANPAGGTRIGFALRITVPDNEVFPAAFAETKPRVDYCIQI